MKHIVAVVLSALVAGCATAPRRDIAVADLNPEYTAPTGPLGPTIRLDYGRGTGDANPIDAFMYFVPLISPELVDSISSAGSRQQARVLSLDRRIRGESFTVRCEFQMSGSGVHRNTFDHGRRVRDSQQSLNAGGRAKRVLDFIHFEGEGYGCICVEGRITGRVPVVTRVELRFNDRGSRSPVTVGLTDLHMVRGQPRKCNELVARVNALAFARNPGDPRMGVVLSSLRGASERDGLWGSIKGSIANLFIPPIRVTPLGSETMMPSMRSAFFLNRSTHALASARVSTDPNLVSFGVRQTVL